MSNWEREWTVSQGFISKRFKAEIDWQMFKPGAVFIFDDTELKDCLIPLPGMGGDFAYVAGMVSDAA